jgi:hypothetical protein
MFKPCHMKGKQNLYMILWVHHAHVVTSSYYSYVVRCGVLQKAATDWLCSLQKLPVHGRKGAMAVQTYSSCDIFHVHGAEYPNNGRICAGIDVPTIISPSAHHQQTPPRTISKQSISEHSSRSRVSEGHHGHDAGVRRVS